MHMRWIYDVEIYDLTKYFDESAFKKIAAEVSRCENTAKSTCFKMVLQT